MKGFLQEIAELRSQKLRLLQENQHFTQKLSENQELAGQNLAETVKNLHVFKEKCVRTLQKFKENREKRENSRGLSQKSRVLELKNRVDSLKEAQKLRFLEFFKDFAGQLQEKETLIAEIEEREAREIALREEIGTIFQEKSLVSQEKEEVLEELRRKNCEIQEIYKENQRFSQEKLAVSQENQRISQENLRVLQENRWISQENQQLRREIEVLSQEAQFFQRNSRNSAQMPEISAKNVKNEDKLETLQRKVEELQKLGRAFTENRRFDSEKSGNFSKTSREDANFSETYSTLG